MCYFYLKLCLRSLSSGGVEGYDGAALSPSMGFSGAITARAPGLPLKPQTGFLLVSSLSLCEARSLAQCVLHPHAHLLLHLLLLLSVSTRELKHRTTQQPNEPKFQIHEYIESQRQKSACCGLK